MRKPFPLLCCLLLSACATNPALIKHSAHAGEPFQTSIYMMSANGQPPPENTYSVKNAPAATGEFTDGRDGQTYKWVKIGTRTWMTQNLNYQTTAHSWAYDSDDNNLKIYGRLYAFDALLQACPKGWHVPTDTEWMQLEKYMGLNYAETGLLGSRGEIADKFLPGRPMNIDVLYGGYFEKGHFTNIGKSAYFWTSTGYGEPIADRIFKRGRSGVYRNTVGRECGLSLRCVKDY